LDILSTGHFIWGKANETIDEMHMVFALQQAMRSAFKIIWIE